MRLRHLASPAAMALRKPGPSGAVAARGEAGSARGATVKVAALLAAAGSMALGRTQQRALAAMVDSTVNGARAPASKSCTHYRTLTTAAFQYLLLTRYCAGGWEIIS